jgi:hypothetical protein
LPPPCPSGLSDIESFWAGFIWGLETRPRTVSSSVGAEAQGLVTMNGRRGNSVLRLNPVGYCPIADSRNSLEIRDIAERNHEEATARWNIRTAFMAGPRKPLSGGGTRELLRLSPSDSPPVL